MPIDRDKLGYLEMAGDLATATKEAYSFVEILTLGASLCSFERKEKMRYNYPIVLKIGSRELSFRAGEDDHEGPVLKFLAGVVQGYTETLEEEQDDLMKLILEPNP
jgi:hypothetical protein